MGLVRCPFSSHLHFSKLMIRTCQESSVLRFCRSISTDGTSKLIAMCIIFRKPSRKNRDGTWSTSHSPHARVTLFPSRCCGTSQTHRSLHHPLTSLICQKPRLELSKVCSPPHFLTTRSKFVSSTDRHGACEAGKVECPAS